MSAALLFPNARCRRAWVLERVQEGMQQSDIAAMLGISRSRAYQIFHLAERKWERNRRMVYARAFASRPLDMGGPRDVWLTFFPSPDPRLDNMEPVSA